MRSLCVFILSVGIVTLSAGPASSAVFTDRSTWEAALASRQDISFDTASGSGVSSLTQGSGGDTVTFTPSGSALYVVSGYGASCTGKCVYEGTGFVSTFALATNTAVGFNVFTLSGSAQTFTIRIFNVGSATPDYTDTVSALPNSSPSPVFFGYTGTAGIKKVEIIGPVGLGAVLDNFSYGITSINDPEPPPPTGGDTPEVPTLGYVGIGFLGVLIGTRRKAHLS